MVPLVPPQVEGLTDEKVAVKAAGCVIVKFLVVVQLLASVITHVYVPAHKFDTVPVPWPVGFPGDQTYVSAPVPPEATMEILPLQTPLQGKFV
jgi:hypothetical protein